MCLSNGRGQGIFGQQKAALQEMGLGFSFAGLLNTALSHGIWAIAKPGVALNKYGNQKKCGKSGSAYY